MRRILFFHFISLLLFILNLIADNGIFLETEHFILNFNESDKKIAKYLAKHIEEIRKEVIEDFGIDFFKESPKKTEVIIASTQKEFFNRVSPNKKINDNIVGMAYPYLNRIVLLSPKGYKEKGVHLNILQIFKHEFSHIALKRLGNNDIPRWFSEGIAMYQSREWNIGRIHSITKAVINDKIIPLDSLEPSFFSNKDESNLAYSESFSFILFLNEKYGKKNFQKIIFLITKEKVSVKEAIEQVCGKQFAIIEKDWIKHLKLHHTWLLVFYNPYTFWVIIAFLFLLTYIKVKLKNKKKLEQWEEEERFI